jgi:sulfoxide reductase heme-binding subunit YedZ
VSGGGAELARDALNPSGALSAFLIIFALAATPWQRLTRNRFGSVWLVRNRRYLGVAGFGYAVLHTVFYLADAATLHHALAELPRLYIWTGWVSLLLLMVLAATSNNASIRALRKNWKSVQRLAYPAAIIGLLHIVSLNDWENPWEPLAFAAPLLALEAWRILRFIRR